MKKSDFYEFVSEHDITSFDGKIRLKLKDGSSYEAVWILGLPDLDPSVDGTFEGIIGDERQVFYLFDERRYAVWPVSQIESLKLLQAEYLAPTKTDFLRQLQLEVQALSDTGKVRERNEDHVLVHDSVFTNDYLEKKIRQESVCVFAVADGLGGHPYGEVASKEVLQHLAAFASALPASIELPDLEEALKQWARDAHQHLLELGKEKPGHEGMGTTVCGLLIHNGRFLAFHAGDSRLYHLRKDEMLLLTRDHRPVPNFSGAQVQNQLSNCLGACSKPYLDVLHISDLATYDHFLLCTDGLSDMVKANDIKLYLGKPDMKKLVKQANRNGGKDNISVVMVRLMRDVN